MNEKYWCWRLLNGNDCHSQSKGFFWFKMLWRLLIVYFNLEISERNTKRWYTQSRLTSKGLYVCF